MLRVLPGDPARVLAGLNASEEQVSRLREQLGLDESLLAQYWSFITGVLQGDLGESARTSRPVRSEEHTSEFQSRQYLVCRLLFEKKKHRKFVSITLLFDVR